MQLPQGSAASYTMGWKSKAHKGNRALRRDSDAHWTTFFVRWAFSMSVLARKRAIIDDVSSSQDLLESYAAGVRDFPEADLHGDDLWGSELQGIQLQGADLGEADLRRVDLAHASLRGADLSHALLTGANLRGADLRDANLSGATLYGVDLTHARLEGADLEGALLYDPELGRRRHVEQSEQVEEAAESR